MKNRSFILYTSHGYFSKSDVKQPHLGFNGQFLEEQLGAYLLGNCYRPYGPAVMRFLIPDSWSPFGRGGLNAYTYCTNDPVNRVDPTGHVGKRRVAKSLPGQGSLIKRQRLEQHPTSQLATETEQQLALRRRAELAQAQKGNSLARGGGAQHSVIHTFATGANGSNQPGNHSGGQLATNAPPPTPQYHRIMPNVEALNIELTRALEHEQRYMKNIHYVAEGTELRQQYEADIMIIRAQIADIRGRLGIQALY